MNFLQILLAKAEYFFSARVLLSSLANENAEAKSAQIAATLDGNQSEARRESEYGRRNLLLKSILRRAPYWAGGHLELARSSLKLDDVATAYASCQAVLELCPVGRRRSEAQLLLGQCYLRRGLVAQAAPIFKAHLDLNPDDIQVREDLAACHMAENKFADVVEILSAVGKSALSHQAQIVLKRAQELMA